MKESVDRYLVCAQVVDDAGEEGVPADGDCNVGDGLCEPGQQRLCHYTQLQPNIVQVPDINSFSLVDKLK